jgi:hypothetical protein
MLRAALSLLLVFCLLFQSSVRLAWGLYYQYNKAVFVRACENRSKPALCCEGKCQLRKALNNDASKDPQAPAVPDGLRGSKELVVYFEFPSTFILKAPAGLRRPVMPEYRFSLPVPPSFKCFKPPAASC